MLIPLPGTELYAELNANGYILERDWSKYVFHNLPVYRTAYFSPQELFNEYQRVYRAYHMNPEYIFSRLIHIRSWQQVKNNFNGMMSLLTMKN